MKKLDVLMMKIDSQRSRTSSIAQDDEYYRKIVEKIETKEPRSK